MPASEAAAERLLSVFAWIWDEHRMRACDDLIRAEMLIKCALLHHTEMVLAIVPRLDID
jgi:hypothetical protein